MQNPHPYPLPLAGKGKNALLPDPVLVVRRLSSVKGKEEPVEHGRELKGY